MYYRITQATFQEGTYDEAMTRGVQTERPRIDVSFRRLAGY